MALCDGRIVVVTGAGRGIGREEALEFARQGARVVVNDVGVSRDGTGQDEGPAEQVVAEIRDMGGEAIADHEDISDFDGAGRLIARTIQQFGGLDVVVNNAGILRDRMLVNMSVDEWDAVIRVHLRGTFCTSKHAADYWRAQSKDGNPVDARIINTSSTSGIYGNVGQSNYGAAKAGIASFSIITAMELERYGVTVNAIAPAALTRMTEDLPRWQGDTAAEWDPRDPANIAPLVAWLGSTESRGITGRVFSIRGGQLAVAEGWVAGPLAEQHGRWEVDELSKVVPDLVARARKNSNTLGNTPG